MLLFVLHLPERRKWMALRFGFWVWVLRLCVLGAMTNCDDKDEEVDVTLCVGFASAGI